MKNEGRRPYRIVLIACSILLGCTELPPKSEGAFPKPSEEEQGRIKSGLHALDITKKIFYVQDPQTELCFAYVWEEVGSLNARAGGPGFSEVPCTAKVRERLLR